MKNQIGGYSNDGKKRINKLNPSKTIEKKAMQEIQDRGVLKTESRGAIRQKRKTKRGKGENDAQSKYQMEKNKNQVSNEQIGSL